MLPPHDWDDDAHRAAIHAAFDLWFRAHMQRAFAQAGQMKKRLTALCLDAQLREVVHVERAVREAEQEAVRRTYAATFLTSEEELCS